MGPLKTKTNTHFYFKTPCVPFQEMRRPRVQNDNWHKVKPMMVYNWIDW